MNKIIEYQGNFYKIYFKHIRKTPFTKKHLIWGFKGVVDPNDATICYIENISTKGIVADGVFIFSNEDRFVKEIGRQISLTRALRKFDNMEFSYLIFEEYFKNKPLRHEIAKIFTKDLFMNPNYFKEEF